MTSDRAPTNHDQTATADQDSLEPEVGEHTAADQAGRLWRAVETVRYRLRELDSTGASAVRTAIERARGEIDDAQRRLGSARSSQVEGARRRLEQLIAQAEEALGKDAETRSGAGEPSRSDVPVQLKASGERNDTDVEVAAKDGVSGAATALPHGERIQKAFGHHDITGVAAHVDDRAGDAAASIGADAYATGNHVAFGRSPSLHTAAHEAAHVVQQRAGVHLSGGVGAVGDSYEQQADAVADAVVRGESAEHILDATPRSGPSGTAAVQRQAAPVPDVSSGEIKIRYVRELKEERVGPVKGTLSLRAEGALKERDADSQAETKSTKGGAGNRQAVLELRRKAEKDADGAIHKASAAIKTSLLQISDPEPLEVLSLPGLDIVLKRDIKVLEASLGADDIDVSALTVTFAGEATLAPLLEDLLPEEFPFDVHGAFRIQLEIKASAETITDILRLRKATKELQEVVEVKARHHRTQARIHDIETELAERKAKKAPRTFPEIYDRTTKLEGELAELRKNESKLAKLARKADGVLERATEAVTNAKEKLGKKLGDGAAKVLGKSAKEALERGLSKAIAKFIPVLNAVSTAQDIYEVASFLATVDWIALLEGGAADGDSRQGTKEAPEDDAEGSGGDESDKSGAVGEGPDGGGGADLTDPVVDPFEPVPHHPAAQKVVNGMLGGGVVLGTQDHELIDGAVPKDLSDGEIAQVIAMMYATNLAAERAQSADELLDDLIAAVQRVRSGEPVQEPAERDEVETERGSPEAAERKRERRPDSGVEATVDLAPALERAFTFDLDRIVRQEESVTVEGITVTVRQHVVLTHTYAEEGYYAEVEVDVIVTEAGRTVKLVTHVPSQPTKTVSKGDNASIRIVISERSTRNEPRDRSRGDE